MDVIDVTEQNFDEVISTGKVIADFYAPWCNPCKLMGYELRMLAKERDDMRIIKVNVDECPPIASRFEIMSIPTVLYFENGELKGKTIGYKNRTGLLDEFGLK